MSASRWTGLVILFFSSQLLSIFCTVWAETILSKNPINYAHNSYKNQHHHSGPNSHHHVPPNSYQPSDDENNVITNRSRPWSNDVDSSVHRFNPVPASSKWYVTTSVPYRKLDAGPSRFTQCSMATILNFARVGLKRIGDAFIDSPETKELNLNENDISEISSTAFARLNHLEVLDLSANDIPTNKLLWFTKHYTLRKLILNDNRHKGTSSRIENTFQPLPRLEELSLKRNGISGFNVDLNTFAPSLKHLHLSGNNIAELDFLDDLPDSLTHLHLDDNEITKVRSSGLEGIAELSVSGNEIEKLCSDQCFDSFLSLKSMKKLHRLNASSNSIKEVANDAFQDTKNMIILDLSRNNIHTLASDVLNSLSELEWLSLSHNSLGSVPKICSLNRLKHLDLSNNNIVTVTKDDLCNSRLYLLHTLILSGNHITEVDNNTFIDLNNLKVLDLSNNLILNLPVNLIRGARSLHTLLLRNNSITDINQLFGITSNVLRELHLQENPISVLKYSDMSLIEIRLKDATLKTQEKEDNDPISNNIDDNDDSIDDL